MKKTLTTLGMGACVLLAFNSCQSTDGDGYYGSEEAVPMSEMTVADGEIPPWLLEDSGDFQVDAGATTHNPNTFPIPEPGETADEIGGSASARQQQPDLAGQDDVIVEERPGSSAVAVEPTTPNPVITPGAAVATTTSPVAPRPTASTGAIKKGTASTRKGSGQKKTSKTAKRVTEPTLVSYKVKPGDNLSEIARRSNTTIEAIRKASGIKGDTIYAGSTIKVPYTPNSYKMAQEGKASKSSSYTVKSGDSIAKIASRHGVTTQALLKANNMSMKQASRIRPGQKLTIPGKGGSKSSNSGSSKGSKTHTVKRGDTLSAIASKYGVTTQALLKANGMTAKQASRIRPGQKLTIPGKTSSKKSSKRR